MLAGLKEFAQGGLRNTSKLREVSVGSLVRVDGGRKAVVECGGTRSCSWDICYEDDGSEELNVDSCRLKVVPGKLKKHSLSEKNGNTPYHLRHGDKVARHHGRLPFSVRVVVVSDTHGKHREVIPPPGDILVHGGDFSNTGEAEQVIDLAAWLGTLPHKEKIVIAGNHDITFDKEYYVDRGHERFHSHLKHPYDVEQVRNSLVSAGNCRYMEDEGADVCGIATYGSPWQPEFGDWAFNLVRGKECRTVWELIPKGTDVLVTHGPPLGCGDKNSQGDPCGCADLRDCVMHIKPRLHIFGHIHEAYGCTTDGKTMFINGSTCDHNYRTSHLPIVIDLPIDTNLPPSVCLSNASEWTLGDVTQWLMKSGLEEFAPNFVDWHARKKLGPYDPVNMFGVDLHIFASKLKPDSRANYDRLVEALKRLYADSF